MYSSLTKGYGQIAFNDSIEFFSYYIPLEKVNSLSEQMNFYKYDFEGFIGTFLVNFATCDQNKYFQKPF